MSNMKEVWENIIFLGVYGPNTTDPLNLIGGTFEN
jgi:hypothetical protein